MTAFDPIDDLIGKVLAREASAEERARLDAWVAASADNRRYFEQMQSLFEKAALEQVTETFDEVQAWQSVKHRLHQQKVISFPMATAWRLAAAIVLALVGGYALYQWQQPQIQQASLATNHQIKSDTLPDGSVTVLNRASRIEYSYSSKEKVRQVKLTGEAYFEVVHETEKPFVIEASDEVLVKDLGTAFNVRAWPGSDTVEVIVESGEVQFYTLKNPGLRLKAGETGIYNKSLKEFSRLSRADANALAYKTKIFSFNNTELRTAVEMLNEVYDSQIVLRNPAIGNCRLTVNFHNDRIEDIADIIAETLGLQLEVKNDNYILNGDGCAK